MNRNIDVQRYANVKVQIIGHMSHNLYYDSQLYSLLDLGVFDDLSLSHRIM